MRVSVLPGNKTQGPSADGAQCTSHYLLTVPSTGFTCMPDVWKWIHEENTVKVQNIYDMWILSKICMSKRITTPHLLPSFMLCRKLSNWTYFMEKGFNCEKDINGNEWFSKHKAMSSLLFRQLLEDMSSKLPCIVVHNSSFWQNKRIIYAL